MELVLENSQNVSAYFCSNTIFHTTVSPFFSLPLPWRGPGTFYHTKQSRTSKAHFGSPFKMKMRVETCTEQGAKVIFPGLQINWQHCHQEHLTKVITAGHEVVVGGVLPTDLILVGHTCGTGDTYTGIYGKKQLHKAAAKWICQRLFDCARCLKSRCLQQQQLPRDRLECI